VLGVGVVGAGCKSNAVASGLEGKKWWLRGAEELGKARLGEGLLLGQGVAAGGVAPGAWRRGVDGQSAVKSVGGAGGGR